MEELFDRSADQLTLCFHGPSDIAEHAQEIGSKFERLIAEHDLAEQLNPLMKNVIYLLEQIDLLVQMRHELQTQVEQQQQRILQLEHEKKERKIEKQRFQTECDQLEEHFRQENQRLLELVSKFKQENQRLMSIIGQEESNRCKYEDSFKLAAEEVDNHYQELLTNEKKKCENIQKELEFRIKKCDQMEESLEKKNHQIFGLREAFQQMKSENLKLQRNQQATEQQLQNQVDLINTIKQQLSCTIRSHLEEQQSVIEQISPKTCRSPVHNSTVYVDKQQQHLKQLQLMQSQLTTLGISVESTVNRGETIDSSKFQQKLHQQLKELQQQQQQQQNQLLSASNSPLHQSPLHRPASHRQNPLPGSLPADPSAKESVESSNNLDVPRTEASDVAQQLSNLKNELMDKSASKFSLLDIRNLWLERNSLQQQVKQLKAQMEHMKKVHGHKINDDLPASSESESCESEKISLRSFGTGDTSRLTIDPLTMDDCKPAQEQSRAEQVMKSRPKDDLPVQGPINREPDEKLLLNKRSSILSFFPSVRLSRLRFN